MLHFPNAKINIGLFVTGKRPDGYHNLESVFYPLPFLKDALEVLPLESGVDPLMEIKGKNVPGALSDNLVLKAFRLLQQAFPDRVQPVHIRLLKAIPMGAGMGGGSADGTFMLRLLNRFFELGLTDDQLAAFALELGSDCPFFVYNTPQFASGRGEKLSPVPVDLSAYSIQVICPELHIPTALAFAGVTPAPAPFNLRQIPDLPVPEWKSVIRNDFEKSVFAAHPVLADIKSELYAQGAVYASMSGSGSSLYGIFPKGEHAILNFPEISESFYAA
ncbi:4-(cytidine 5'-diphospho)-2-C-methyl-D-erythritol kinase [Rurimicrobium arvi]|uniref:4-diphosphocytidyl-2-C-methyl-D-erythritol kinase n=1 Tax=Rurimicrobium arvi TaxID=2049916 RepID=A0ABP8MW60_9BACT